MANILDIASYSETEQKAINQLINNNGGFYSSLNIADIPFSDIVTIDNNGIESVVPFFEAPITVNDKQLNVTLKQSGEQKCWFICVEYNGDTYNASGDLQANPGTTAVSDNTVTFGGINNQECTITNTSTTTGAPSQVRMTQLKIVYAE